MERTGFSKDGMYHFLDFRFVYDSILPRYTQTKIFVFNIRIDGAPALGWPDTIAFLALPIFLVISQVVSMELMSPKDSPQANNVVLKVLPLMIGWFALNVPAALSVYWVVNNLVTTSTTLAIRNSMDLPTVSASSGGAAAAAPPAQSAIFTPPREKPAGFGPSEPVVDSSGVKPITSNVVDVEIESEEAAPAESAGEGMAESASSGKKRGKKRKKKKKN